MARDILFVTTDQQRYDALGCNGGAIARTPVIDGLAADGVRYERAYNQNTVCMPARSTMLTGQYPLTHGVTGNGIPLPTDAPSVAAWLAAKGGYSTALLGKAHFEPGLDLDLRWEENRMATDGRHGPMRGFEHVNLALHGALAAGRPQQHYGAWLQEHHPEHLESFAHVLMEGGGGDTEAPETKNNPIPTGWYHTDWVADRTIDWLDTIGADDRFFCWMSFPDPHHPWDPPASELSRVPWQDLALPPGLPDSDDELHRILAAKPAHWLAYHEGRWRNAEGGPWWFRPPKLTHDMIREINAKTHVMNELIDEALGRVLRHLDAAGRLENTDVIFTTDHGELQGDLGLVFKGPFHVDALMRLPMVWRPAAAAGVEPASVSEPVGQVDLAPTFCAIADVPVADWMQGEQLPTAPGNGREQVICTWDSQLPGYGMHLRSLYRDGWLCTAYDPSTVGQPTGIEGFFERMGLGDGPQGKISYDGSEGELYRVADDPWCWENRWDDPACAAVRSDLVEALRDALPAERRMLAVESPT